MKKTSKERFRADKDGNLDRRFAPDRSEIDEYDKKIINQIEESGTFGKLILATFDFVVNKIICLFNDLFVVLFKDGFNMFGKDTPTKLKERNEKFQDRVRNGGVIVKYTYIRYLITILVPPLGIFMAKGLSGIVNIVLSIAFMYISYPIGIVYGILISYNSYYADLYHYTKEKEINNILKETNQDGMNDSRMVFIISIVFIVVCIVLYVYNTILKK